MFAENAVRAEPVPPEPHSLVAYLDASLVEKILDVPQREWEPYVHHHGQANNHGAGLEVAKWAAFCHQKKLSQRPIRLKPVSSDKTLRSRQPTSTGREELHVALESRRRLPITQR